MRVRVVTDAQALRALEADWSRLHAASTVASVFNSWPWMEAWWRHYGAGHALRLYVAEEEGRVVGIVPSYVRRRRCFRAVPLRVLQCLGTGGDTAPDDLDALLDPAHEGAAAAALAEAIAADRAWDVLHLTDMAPQSPAPEAIRRALERRGESRAAVVGTSARISYLPLPASWEAYVEGQSRNARAKLRKSRRQEGVTFDTWTGATPLEGEIRTLARLHQLRWAGRATDHAFSSDAYLRFHLEVMDRCQRAGWLRLHTMRFEGRPVAMIYCYAHRGTVFYFQSGFDPEVSRLAPGHAVMGFAIEQAIAEGASRFDMLRGEYDYKTRWAPERRETLYVRAFRRGLAGALAHLRYVRLPALRRRFPGAGAPPAAPAQPHEA